MMMNSAFWQVAMTRAPLWPVIWRRARCSASSSCGAAGSRTFTPDYSFATPIFPVTALKPMGAGDGFMGGLLAGLAQGHTLETAVRRGAATAAIIVAGVGCAPASPDTATLDAFLARY